MYADIDPRLTLEDQAEIQRLAARFSDALNERDPIAFGTLGASDGAVWAIWALSCNIEIAAPAIIRVGGDRRRRSCLLPQDSWIGHPTLPHTQETPVERSTGVLQGNPR